jgi:hypothetical protein
MLRNASAIGASRCRPTAWAIRYPINREKMITSPATRLIVGQRGSFFREVVNHLCSGGRRAT